MNTEKQWGTPIRILILLGFAAFFLYKNATGTLTAYVHPRMIPLVLFAAGVMVIFALNLLLKKRTLSSPFSLRKYGVFLVALCLAWLVPSQSLADASGVRTDYQKAELASSAVATAQNPKASDEALPDDSITALTALDPIPIEGATYTTVLNELNTHVDQYKGRRVSTKGFVYRAPDFAPHQFVVARMMMACCAADTIPVGFLCQLSDDSQLKDGQWVQIVGVLSTTEYNGELIPFIDVQSFEPTKPIEEYVYP